MRPDTPQPRLPYPARHASAEDQVGPEPFSVLFVCTGNICRSPMAERLLLARVQPGLISASSAGTYGLTGYPMDVQAALVTRELDADPDGHSARELTAALVEGAGLVLAASEEHRDRALRLAPRAMRRTFTLREFARLGAALPALPASPDEADLARRVAEVAGRRGIVEAPVPGGDDVGDPFGGTLEGMRSCGRLISDVTDDVIQILGLPRSNQS